MVFSPPKRVTRAAVALHVALYRKTRGKFGSTMANVPVLLITTFGRKSGKPYTNPVAYIKDGQDYLVTASASGVDRDPGWYLNLKARREAKIEVGGTAFNVQATITEGEERTRLYEKFKASSSNFVKYEQGTSRVIPVIRLSPTGEQP